MIAVLQRVKGAAVSVAGEVCGKCGPGLMILLGVTVEDTEEDMRLLCDKILRLRIFEDGAGKMNLSLTDVGGEALVVSNFTLAADYSHGNRPSYMAAARPEQAEPLYRAFADRMAAGLSHVGRGIFGADMEISMTADGPVTIHMDSRLLRRGNAV